MLDDFKQDPQVFDHDIIGVEAMKRYYKYYFFDRAPQMAYPISAEVFDHKDDILTLLSMNTKSVTNYQNDQKKVPPLFLRQAFQSAAKVFKVIATATQGVIVPYTEEGEQIINELCSAFDLNKQFELIKKAQRYAVNLYPHTIESLCKNRGICEVQEGSGIYYLQQEFYSPDFGVADEMVNEMKLQCF